MCFISFITSSTTTGGHLFSNTYIYIEIGEPEINIIYTFISDISWHKQHKFNSQGAYIHSTSSSKQPNMKIYDMFARIMSNFCLLIKRIFIDVHIRLPYLLLLLFDFFLQQTTLFYFPFILPFFPSHFCFFESNTLFVDQAIYKRTKI